MSKKTSSSRSPAQSVDDWVTHLSNDKMSGFSTTVVDVTSAVDSSKTSAADVSQSILRDPALTSRLLKLANSFFYNPNNNEINTVTRAVMVLGFDQVRTLALSLLLIDSLNDAQQRDKLTDEMALAFHAAVQAEQLAKQQNEKAPERIFVAALLYRLGNMAFWGFSDSKVTELLNVITSQNIDEQTAEEQVLGFDLKTLSLALTKKWSLGELLESALSDDLQHDNTGVKFVLLGQKIAAATNYGWDSAEVDNVIKEIALACDMPESTVSDMIQKSAKSAKQLTSVYGVSHAGKKIIQPIIDTQETSNKTFEIKQTQPSTVESNNKTDKTELIDKQKTLEKQELEQIEQRYPKPDPKVQLSVLSDMMIQIQERSSINTILQITLEGLYRGVGMDRSLFALLSKSRNKLICKYALGTDQGRLRREMLFDLSEPDNIFNVIIKSKKVILVSAEPEERQGILDDKVIDLLGPPPYLVMPVIVQNQAIGIFLVDRNASKRAILQEDILAFQQFCQQANMGLTFLTTKD